MMIKLQPILNIDSSIIQIGLYLYNIRNFWSPTL